VGALKLYKEQNNTSVKGALGLYVGFKKGCAGAYRYGFNGQEKVDEIAGVGNHNTALFWEYDTRLGRRWNVDPVDQEYQSPYSVLNNNPLLYLDFNGDFGILFGLMFLSTPVNAPSMNQAYNKIKMDEANTSYNIELASVFLMGPLAKCFTTVGGKIIQKTVTQPLIKTIATKTIVTSLKNNSKIVGTIIKAGGDVGENFLKTLGGISQKYFPTTVGKGGRFVDQFVKGVANESKVGYTSLTTEIEEQIAKDVELLANYEKTGVKEVVWNFFRSPTTGKIGASKPLLKALQDAGIKTNVIELP
jgi:hypothetical protein